MHAAVIAGLYAMLIELTIINTRVAGHRLNRFATNQDTAPTLAIVYTNGRATRSLY